MKKIQQKYKDIGLKLLTATMVFIIVAMPASAFSNPYIPYNTFQLTNNDVTDHLPSISGDGKTVAFVSESEITDSAIYVTRYNSGRWSEPTRVTYNTQRYNNFRITDLSISRDGRKIAFAAGIGDYSEIYVMNSDGTEQRKLTDNRVCDASPSISGDGSKIAFESGDGQYCEYGLYVMNSDGTGRRQLTDINGGSKDPQISANGKKIAFNQRAVIYVINWDGTGLRQLTSDRDMCESPSISGDGRKIAFESGLDGHDFEIHVINSDGTGRRKLTNNKVGDHNPKISANGKKIAYHSDLYGGFSHSYIVNSDGTGRRLLSKLIYYPSSISADGGEIACISNYGDGDFEILVSVNPMHMQMDPKLLGNTNSI
jgi:Tol biopolymer transport system component